MRNAEQVTTKQVTSDRNATLNDIYTANFSVDRTGPVTEWTSPRLMYALEIFYFVTRRSLIDG